MKKQTVHQLRKNGWKVKVGHKRVLFRFNTKTGVKETQICVLKEWNEKYPSYLLSAKGGITEL
jgi:hypothetical protein